MRNVSSLRKEGERPRVCQAGRVCGQTRGGGKARSDGPGHCASFGDMGGFVAGRAGRPGFSI